MYSLRVLDAGADILLKKAWQKLPDDKRKERDNVADLLKTRKYEEVEVLSSRTVWRKEDTSEAEPEDPEVWILDCAGHGENLFHGCINRCEVRDFFRLGTCTYCIERLEQTAIDVLFYLWSW